MCSRNLNEEDRVGSNNIYTQDGGYLFTWDSLPYWKQQEMLIIK
jgi:hypothetical protein